MPGVFNRDDFEIHAQSNGGLTGSGKVLNKSDNSWYQLKKPIGEAAIKRRIKARDNDQENFGEFIASRIARAIVPENLAEQQRIPDVSLVVLPRKKSPGIVSRFLVGERVETLNQYIDPSNQRPPRSPQKPNGRLVDIKLVDHHSRIPYQPNLNSPENQWLKKELSRAIAISALIGDHDINADNMLVISMTEKKKVARIDFGHAFADLMRYPAFGGQRVHDNNILDFFNRSTLDGVPEPGTSKLWRSYPALIPSQAMVDAMNELVASSSEKKIREGIQSAKADFLTLLKEHNVDKEHIMKSLQYIAEHVSSHKIPLRPENTALDRLFQAIETYVSKNVAQMNYAAQVMQLQLDVNAYLDSQGKDSSHPSSPNIYQLESRYKALNASPLGPFSWIKNSEDSPACQGNFLQYLHFRNEEKLQKKSGLTHTAVDVEMTEIYKQCIQDDRPTTPSTEDSNKPTM